MSASPVLRGLDRLLNVCQEHHLPLRLSPPQGSPPKAGEPFFGRPFDPLLAAVYQRMGGSLLGDLYLVPPGQAWNELHGWNESMKQDAEEPFLSCSLFGRVPHLAYYYGTLPALAEGGEPQPVVFIDSHEAPFAIPVASHVDSFFDTYARYLERSPQESAAGTLEPSTDGIAPRPFFPWAAPELLMTDERLIEGVRAGRFDFLANGHPDALEWLQRLQEVG